ncbi:protein TRC8 homolog isoform X1 [Anopheles moucheti]|uniref:protein TRC8 homolog isoform X1 n=1 Tax=Anopheles moucheti TaxID=186751 RepID=UPI0022F09402|nr:protein TRC8 homolog isoform X1 [Anopheles moucheti]
MSVVRTKVLGLVDVIMRVPSLFIIDEILKMGMGVPMAQHAGQLPNSTAINLEPPVAAMLPEDDRGMQDSIEVYKFISFAVFKFLFCLFGAISAACVFMLWTRHLVIVYMYIVSVGLIFLSYWSNVSALSVISDSPSLLEDVLSLNMERLLDPGGVLISILPHLLAQWLMGVIFAYIHLGPRHKIIQKALPFSFLMPLLLAMLPLPTIVLKHSPAFAAILPLVLSKIALWSSSFDVVKTILSGYQHARNFASNFGIATLIENEWQRLNVPCVLRVFWTIRLLEHLISLLMSSEAPLRFAATVQSVLVSGCETLTAVLGMTSIISLICHYIGKMFQLFLLSEDYDEDKSIGTVSAILFYILALQTGLTSLSPDKRIIRLCRNMCLLVTALLHFLHNIVAPILMSLSAARNPSRKRHARALIVCAFLLIAPGSLLAVLWASHSPSTWLLAVTAFSVEVIVKVLVSLATYTLFLLDARRQTFWEKLDDYVYYIRAFGNSVEFCFGIFLFFNGAWILIFESEMIPIGGAIRALMMGIHAYFNIWCEARAGWVVFMKRRTAVHKISSLPEATTVQLHQFDDVCAICYQDMTSAKITRCNHYFHGVCLRKWLYVQDRCPLCHEIIMNQDGNGGDDSTEVPTNNMDNARAQARVGGRPGNETTNRQQSVAQDSSLHSSDQTDALNQPLFDDTFLEEQITNHIRASASRSLGEDTIDVHDAQQMEGSRRSTLQEPSADGQRGSHEHRFVRLLGGISNVHGTDASELGQSDSGLLTPLSENGVGFVATDGIHPSESGSSYASTSESISSITEDTGGSSTSSGSSAGSGTLSTLSNSSLVSAAAISFNLRRHHVLLQQQQQQQQQLQQPNAPRE